MRTLVLTISLLLCAAKAHAVEISCEDKKLTVIVQSYASPSTGTHGANSLLGFEDISRLGIPNLELSACTLEALTEALLQRFPSRGGDKEDAVRRDTTHQMISRTREEWIRNPAPKTQLREGDWIWHPYGLEVPSFSPTIIPPEQLTI